DLAPRFHQFADRRSVEAHVAVLLRAAFAYIYLHEQSRRCIRPLATRILPGSRLSASSAIRRRGAVPPCAGAGSAGVAAATVHGGVRHRNAPNPGAIQFEADVWTLVPAGEEPILPTISGVFPWRQPSWSDTSSAKAGRMLSGTDGNQPGITGKRPTAGNRS